MDYFTSSPQSKQIAFIRQVRVFFSIFLFLIVVPVHAGIEGVSTQTVTITAQVASEQSAPPVVFTGASGGASDLPVLNNTTGEVIFTGLAYPSSMVSLIKNGVLTTEVQANSDGSFRIDLPNLTPGVYSFGIRSSITNYFTVIVTKGITTFVDGIFFPPTIALEKEEVKKGDAEIFFGKSVANAVITLLIHSDEPILKRFKADKDGTWIYTLDTSMLPYGEHTAQAKSETENDTSSYSSLITFTVGTTNKKKTTKENVSCGQGDQSADLSCDKKINLVDFSILAFWYNKLGFPATADFNHDGKVNLVDFSIMAFHWTG